MADMLADALMIVLAQRLAGMRPRIPFVLLGAALGTAAAAMARAMQLTRAAQAALWLPLAVAMAAAASIGQARRRIVRDGVLLLCAAGLMGGVVQALAGATGSLRAAYALGLLASAGMAARAMRARKTAQGVQCVRVTIAYRGRRASIEALVDSGNLLRDYLTQRPVIVLPEAFAKGKLAADGLGKRPVFAETAGGRRMMWCFTPDEVSVRIGGRCVRLEAAAAYAPGLAGMALLPGALLGDHDGEGNGAAKP